MSPRVLFCGYYGLGNTGDEAVLAASVAMFRALAPELALAALSGDPARTASSLGIEAAPRMHPAAILSELRRCTLLLSGGGSLLQDRTSLKSLLYYLWLLRVARRLGKRTMVFAQGIGPLIRPAARRWTARTLAGVDAITVRDPESMALLHEIGVRGKGAPEIEVTADPVFALSPLDTDRVHAAAPTRPCIAVSLRPWSGVDKILEPLAGALKRFEGRASVLAWPLYGAEDLPLCEALVRLLPGARVMREDLAPAEWMALAGRMDAVVGMRLHALIFAAACAVPLVGISYDPKVDALLARLGAPAAGTAGALDPDVLTHALEGALSQDPSRRAERESLAAQLRQAAIRNFERALQLVGSGAP